MQSNHETGMQWADEDTRHHRTLAKAREYIDLKAGGKSSLNNKGLRRKTLIMANEMTPSEVYACQAWEDSDIWGDIHDNCTHQAPVTVDKEFWNRGHIGDCINTICNHL